MVPSAKTGTSYKEEGWCGWRGKGRGPVALFRSCYVSGSIRHTNRDISRQLDIWVWSPVDQSGLHVVNE